MTAINPYLFVYGTLRKACKNEMSIRLFEESKWIGYGQVRGEIYLQDFYPVLTESESGFVTGEVVELLNPAESFDWLDNYEDFDKNNTESSLYQRVTRNVSLENGQNIETWLYLFNGQIDGLRKIETGDFLEEIPQKSF